MSAKEKGIFIEICGPNGSGKTTTALVLAEALRIGSREVVCQKFPNYDQCQLTIDYGDPLNDWPLIGRHRPGGAELWGAIHCGFKLPGHSLQKLCAEDRYNTWYNGFDGGLERVIQNGGIVIAEGGVTEARVYGQLSGMTSGEIDRINAGLPTSDVTFILLDRVTREAREPGHAFETTDLGVIANEIRLYRQEAIQPRHQVINNNRPVEEIVAEIISKLPLRAGS